MKKLMHNIIFPEGSCVVYASNLFIMVCLDAHKAIADPTKIVRDLKK
jgi:hypothetical protein